MRALPYLLEEKLKVGERAPAYKVYAYDTKVDSLSSIVLGTNSQEPLDLTDMVQGDLQWTPAQLSFTLSDPDGRFHGDSGTYRNYLEDGCCIRLKEGDARVSESSWVWTFTGTIKGQVGWTKGPRGNMITSKVTVFNRDSTQSYKRRKITTRAYTNGTDLGIMLHDIANDFMGLTDGEIKIPLSTGRVFMHKQNQLALVAPWDGANLLSEVISRVPFFDGEGKLNWWSKNLNRYPDRVLPDYIKVFKLEMSPMTGDVINKVKVIFLDSNLERIDGVYQKLGQASLTSGFFTDKETIRCYWSEDRKQRAETDSNSLHILKSLNDNLLPVAEYERYERTDEYSGEIQIKIASWVPILASILLADYVIGTMLKFDQVSVPGPGFWPTIPIGRMAQAADLVAILAIMMSLGSAQYEVWGTPYDMAYLEKKSIAIEEGIEYWEEIEKEINNDFIGSFDQADAVAVTELIYQKSLGFPRILTIDDDLSLEVGDIIQIPDGRQIFCLDMKKAIKRGEVPKLEINGFKVLTV